MRATFLILILLSLMLAPLAFAFNALDADFFSEPIPLNPQPGVQTLNPDYFRSTQKTLPKSAAGAYGCMSVGAYTPTGEASVIGEVAQRYCDSAPQVRWIPNRYAWQGSQPLSGAKPAISGYYQVCCLRKADVKIRKPGPR